jgi:hypothetical protein
MVFSKQVVPDGAGNGEFWDKEPELAEASSELSHRWK